MMIFTYIVVNLLLGNLATNALEDDIATVHILPHSHCDPGWLETYETYFRQDVSTILSDVFDQLKRNDARKFVWSETSFFSTWYDQLAIKDKKEFVKLVKSGRLEFIGGGWVQNDEACPHYSNMIDQTTVGHQYLQQAFGVTPKYGWQIDPFGHSDMTPSIFRLFGYDAMVINRINFQSKAVLKTEHNMEFIWKGANLGGNRDMFTHVLHTHYSAPKGFDWENWESEEVNDNNIERLAKDLVEEMARRLTAYRTKHLLVPFGDDFKFKNARRQFENMDKLIEYINRNVQQFKMRIQYSTLKDYFSAVEATNTKFPTVVGDFFPYADNSDSFWTGYYTTRPFLKYTSRTVSASLRAAEISFAVARSRLPPENRFINFMSEFDKLLDARRNNALFLHHDAITGTARQHVVNDYLERMTSSRKSAEDITKKALAPMMSINDLDFPWELQSNPDSFGVGVYPLSVLNTLGWSRTETICRKSATAYASVSDLFGNPIESQIHAMWSEEAVKDPEAMPSHYTLCFVYQLPPMSTSTFIIEVRSSKPLKPVQETNMVPVTVFSSEVQTNRERQDCHFVHLEKDNQDEHADFILNNGVILVRISPLTGLIQSIQDVASKIILKVDQEFAQYTTSSSGAYLFRPENEAQAIPELKNAKPIIRIVHGLKSEVAYTSIGSMTIEVEISKSPISSVSSRRVEIRTGVVVDENRELVIRFNTDIASGQKFYSNNGADFIRRRYDPTRSIPSNYYPSVSGGRIEDSGRRLSILTGHTSGVTSQNSGVLEFMVHRSLNQDDGRGLAQPINDRSRAQITMRLFFESSQSARAEASHRKQMITIDHPSILLYPVSADRLTSEQWRARIQDIKVLSNNPPNNINILSMMVRDSTTDEVVLRLENLAESNEVAIPTKVSLQNLFLDEVGKVRETSLSTVYEYPTLSSPSASYPEDMIQLNFDVSAEVIQTSSIAQQASGVEAGGGKQNSEEEGVFISDVALKVMDEESHVNNGNPRNRRLLSSSDEDMKPFVLVGPRQIRSFAANFRYNPNYLAEKDSQEVVDDPHTTGEGRLVQSPEEIDLFPGFSIVICIELVSLGLMLLLAALLRADSVSSGSWEALNKDARHLV
uniref:Alpha-mannosidase n=1 Tax=Spongospora subterranea TaxID=70186 RepID=A0A0H5RPJ4_9EUKA|eukprot:CRZ10644.1 hypothetical protein [Spongospora subterranea]